MKTRLEIIVLSVALIITALSLSSGRVIAQSREHTNWLENHQGDRVIVFLANETIIPEAKGRAVNGTLVDVIPGGIVLRLDTEIFISYSAISLIERAK